MTGHEQHELPRSLGRYLPERPLGSAGMGVVYLAHDPELERSVAVKLLRPDATVSEQAIKARQRLLQEARAMAQLAHPNVVTVYDVGTLDGQVWVAMEYVDGLNLRRWLAAAPQPIDRVVGVFLAAGEGLVAAHRAGILHRDVKPENIMVGRDGRVRVLDFGLARRVDHTPRRSHDTFDLGQIRELRELDAGDSIEPPTDDGDALHAHTGGVLGTPRYLAPEQIFGRPPDERTDQFAFFVALYEAVYGASPFAGDSIGAYLVAVRLGQVQTPTPTDPTAAALWPVIARGLALDPEARHPSLDDALQAVREALDAGTIDDEPAPPPAPVRQDRTPAWIATAAVVVIAITLVVRSVWTPAADALAPTAAPATVCFVDAERTLLDRRVAPRSTLDRPDGACLACTEAPDVQPVAADCTTTLVCVPDATPGACVD